MTDRPYLSSSIDELEVAFEKATEFAEFKAVADELQHRKTPRAGKLRLRVVMAMGKARKAEGGAPNPALPLFRKALASPPLPAPPSPPSPSSPLSALLARFDLEAPDGRPLHRYRLGADGYDQLLALVCARAGRLDECRPGDAALVVLWASAWFRRDYTGGIRKYRDLGGAIGATLPEAQWRTLIERGLAWWKRPVIERASGRHRLLTLAVEGGFPVRVLAAGEGWLSRYLNEVVGRLLGIADEPTPDDAFAIADGAKEELRETYRQATFIALSADLALAIVRLRRIAEQTAPGVTPSTVLDQVRPDWRDELPIAADSGAARTLIDGMLSAEKIARGLSGGAGCVRVLRRHADGWRAGLRLSLTGEFKAEALAGLAGRGMRLGVHPHGALARAVGEELAFLDPPGEDGDTWRLRRLTRRTEVDGVPLAAKIEVLVQSPNGAARTMQWPGGAPERSDVITFEIDVEDESGPTSMVLAANGSASLRAERVILAAPLEWDVRWRDADRDGAPVSLGNTDDERMLWLADGAVLVESTDGGLLYCIETGVDEELRDRIALSGASPQDFDGADDVPLFVGRPAVQCLRGRAPVQPAAGELLWRYGRNDQWRDFAQHRLPHGVVDIMWRDATTRFVRDRVRVAIVPQTARIDRERDGTGWRYTFAGFGDLEISPTEVEGLYLERRTGRAWALSFHSHPRRRVAFELCSAGSSRAIRIDVPFPLSDGLAHWDGRLIPPGSVLTAAELSELVAFSESSITLCSELKHAEVEVPAHYTLGERELALRPLADRIATDLATGGIDAWVELSFLGGTSSPYRVQPFDSTLRCENGDATVLRAPGLSGAPLQIVGRNVATPHEERVLAQPALEDILNRRPAALPENLTGAWLIYLRSGRVVRSRPSIIPFDSAQSSSDEGLPTAVTIASPAARRAAIDRCLEDLCSGSEAAGADIVWLHRLVSSLDGIPAATFDVLSALPQTPAALALLLLTSGDESAQAAVWRLEAELPFLWTALPLDSWQTAIDALGQLTLDPLCASGLDEAAAIPIAQDVVSAATKRVAALDNALAFALSTRGLIEIEASAPSLIDAASGYVRRTYDRGELAIGIPRRESMFREGSLAQHLPAWFEERFDRMHLEALDAPLAAAAATAGLAPLSLAQLRRCKTAAVDDPIYFAEGLAAALIHGHQGRLQVA